MQRARLTTVSVFAVCVTAPAIASVVEYTDEASFLASITGESMTDGYETYAVDAPFGSRTISLDYFDVAYDGTTDFGVTDLVDPEFGVNPVSGHQHLRVNYGGGQSVNARFTFVVPIEAFGTFVTDIDLAPLSYQAGLTDGTVVEGTVSEVTGNGGVSYFGLNAEASGARIEWINMCMTATEFDGVFFDETTVSVPVNTVIMDWTTVGDAGNPADPTTGLGSVGYEYRIGTYEVTNAQYVAFLNSVAASDPNFLYHQFMGSSLIGGIIRSGSDGSYTYSVKANMGNKPVNYVDFASAARMANWMTNGQGSGDTESGAYTFTGTLSVSGVTRDLSNPNQVFVPTEDEWYKAAFHQPAADGGDTDSYWLYATQSNAVPTVASATSIGDVANPGQDVVNYDKGADWNGSSFGNLTTVGSAGSTTYYGLFDMNGNVYEWNEAVLSTDDIVSGTRGGGFSLPEAGLVASHVPPFGLSVGYRIILTGFRLASPVPLPSTPDPTDFDGDGRTDISDLLLLLSVFNTNSTDGDTNNDGVVDITDLLALLAAFDQSCN